MDSNDSNCWAFHSLSWEHIWCVLNIFTNVRIHNESFDESFETLMLFFLALPLLSGNQVLLLGAILVLIDLVCLIPNGGVIELRD